MSLKGSSHELVETSCVVLLMYWQAMVVTTYKAEYIALKEAATEGIYLATIFNYINNRLGLDYIFSIPLILIDN